MATNRALSAAKILAVCRAGRKLAQKYPQHRANPERQTKEIAVNLGVKPELRGGRCWPGAD